MGCTRQVAVVFGVWAALDVQRSLIEHGVYYELQTGTSIVVFTFYSKKTD